MLGQILTILSIEEIVSLKAIGVTVLVIEVVIVITETNLIQEITVGSEIMNSKIILMVFKI